MKKPLQIQILGDGKPGHENQSHGLAEAIARLTPVHIKTIGIRDQGLLRSVLESGRRSRELAPPDLILGAGHSVHAPLLALAKTTGTPCVVLMKPSLPAALFDLCLIPVHDLGSKTPAANVVATRGALNRVPPPVDSPRRGGLILIGGPSTTHGWNLEPILKAVSTIVRHHGSIPWRITDSRRTPIGVLDRLTAACPALAAYPHHETGRDWLPLRLAETSEVWVTEDSVSMIYEALSSGARVGLLPLPRIKDRGRVARGIDALVADGYATPFARWDPGSPLPPPPQVLREAERCARIVLERFFPARIAP